MSSFRAFAAVGCVALLTAGCVNKKLPPAELAKLRGGATKVVVFTECAPINQIIGSKIAETRYALKIKGKRRGVLSSCSSKRINVASGQHNVIVDHPSGSLFERKGRLEVFKPGKTQYLFLYRDGYANLFHRWSTADHAAQMRKVGKGIKQFW